MPTEECEECSNHSATLIIIGGSDRTMVERTVYVLGAGASFDAGGPLIKDFFSVENEKSRRVHERYFYSDDKFLSLKSIYDDWAQKNTYPNVEGFFKKVEFQGLIGKRFLDTHTSSAIIPSTVEDWLVWYIAAYVTRSIQAQKNRPSDYQEFVQSLKGYGRRSAVLTFNYDLVVDETMLDEFRELDYGIGDVWGMKEVSRGIPLIKLHGSLNWIQCPDCGRLEVWDEPIAHKHNRVSCVKKCGGYKERLIVPPNPSKGPHLENIYRLWKKADKLLSEADRIVLIGYSMPQIDTSARELLTDPVRRVREFEIVNTDVGTLVTLESALGRKSSISKAMSFSEFVSIQSRQ